MSAKTQIIQKVGFIWGLVGISAIFVTAVLRMIPYFTTAYNSKLSSIGWVVLVLWAAFMLFTEGYRGFHKQFSPMVAARLIHLLNAKPRFIDIILAPIFCMGYFHATKRRLIRTWLLTLGIVILVIVVSRLNQPWRGIIDLGVILGLSYGLATIIYFTIGALFGKVPIADAEVDEA